MRRSAPGALSPFTHLLVTTAIALAVLLSHSDRVTGDDMTSQPDPGTTSAGHVSMVLDAGGNPVISHVDSDGRLRIVHCNDPACAGNDESRTTPDTAGPFSHTSIALDGANPVVSYRGGTGSALKLLRCDDSDCAGGGESITSPDIAAAASTSLALDAEGFPVVAYRPSLGTLRLLHCNDALCSGGDDSITTPVFAEEEDIADYVSLVLDGQGRPVVAFSDATDSALHLLRCDDVNCADENDAVTLIDNAGNGDYSSLLLDALDRPVMAHAAPAGLRIARCPNAACNLSPALETADPRPGAGVYASLRLDGAGNPVVSYIVAGEQTLGLHLLHCNDPDCDGGDESIETVDADAEVASTALVLDAAGRPVIAYVAGGALHLARCDDPDCDGGAQPGEASISGTVSAGAPVAGAFVQACAGDGLCPHALTDALGHYSLPDLTAGAYAVSVSAPGNLLPQTHTVALATGMQHVEHFALAPPVLPAAGTTVTAPGSVLGTPVVRVDTAFHVTTMRCSGGAGVYRLLHDGVQTALGNLEADGPTLLAADVTATGIVGAALLQLEVSCPNPNEDADTAFDLYVEPLAFVRDVAGAPLAGATVTLHRAEAIGGPFAPVPDGSALMGPSNRDNPSTAAADGGFGWQTMTGFYFVRASSPGCHAPGDPGTPHIDSAVFEAPPPLMSLDLRLACGDADTDGDGYSDARETELGFDPLIPCPVMRADIDGDTEVSIVDLSAVAGSFGRAVPPASARVDQDGDAEVTIFDLSVVAGHFGKSIVVCP